MAEPTCCGPSTPTHVLEQVCVHGSRVTCVQRGAEVRTEAGGVSPPSGREWAIERPLDFFACLRLSRVVRSTEWLGSRHLTRTAFTLRFHTHP